MSSTRRVATIDLEFLHRSFYETVTNAANIKLLELVESKLGEQGISLQDPEREEILRQITADPTQLRLSIDRDNSDRDLSIKITDEDFGQLNRAISRLEAKLPELFEQSATFSAELILKSLKQRWKEESKLQRKEIASFERNLYLRWKRPLELLRQFLTMCGELAASYRAEVDLDSARPKLWELLTRLNARALRVAEEIFCLLKTGHADGALVRWRTVHEIAVTIRFLVKHGEDAAIRYIDHQWVGSKKSADEYQKVFGDDLESTISQEELQRLNDGYSAMLNKHGFEFRHDYGWAAKALSIAKPNFKHIEESVAASRYRPHYQWASQGLHAGSKGTYAPLSGDAPILLIGPSNTGLADPAQALSHVLTEIAEDISSLHLSLDALVILKMLRTLRDEINEAFLECHWKLEEDEAKLDASESGSEGALN